MKIFVGRDRMIESLINLRKEFEERGENEAVFKINSCLYSDYPHEPIVKTMDAPGMY